MRFSGDAVPLLRTRSVRAFVRGLPFEDLGLGKSVLDSVDRARDLPLNPVLCPERLVLAPWPRELIDMERPLMGSLTSSAFASLQSLIVLMQLATNGFQAEGGTALPIWPLTCVLLVPWKL